MELGKIEISSRLGESFAARVPFSLNDGEMVSNLYVELASVSDYQNLNVHFHPALHLIRTDIIRDRLTNWIELSSRTPISTPVFFLVLKVRYGNATHFKKYPVFLDVSDAGRPAGSAPAPVTAENADAAEETTYIALDTPLLAEEHPTREKPATTFKPFDGWARISSYGPIVYGDTLFTIADRLRIDQRYTIRQVMVALFEKNRAMFSEENLNLPIAGAFLAAPLAEEVERHTYEQALSVIREHDRQWKELKKDPRYASVAEAQQSRYSRRLGATTPTR